MHPVPKTGSKPGPRLVQDYIEEAGSTSECSVVAPYSGCGDKQKMFIEKMASKSAADVEAQVVRLTAMKEKPMKCAKFGKFV